MSAELILALGSAGRLGECVDVIIWHRGFSPRISSNSRYYHSMCSEISGSSISRM